MKQLILAAAVLALGLTPLAALTPPPAETAAMAATAPVAGQSELLDDIMAARAAMPGEDAARWLARLEKKVKAATADDIPSLRQEFDTWQKRSLTVVYHRRRAEGLIPGVSFESFKSDYLQNIKFLEAQRSAQERTVKFEKLAELIAYRPGQAFDGAPTYTPAQSAEMISGRTAQAILGALWKPFLGTPYVGLKVGSRGSAVRDMQRALLIWSRGRFDLKPTGVYDEATVRALTLFKRACGTGRDGNSLVNDTKTAMLIGALLDGKRTGDPKFRLFHRYLDTLRPAPTLAQKVLSAVPQKLGIPYHLGGNGTNSTDCGKFVLDTLLQALNYVGEQKNRFIRGFSRCADLQYLNAVRYGMTRFLAGAATPRAGDIIFMKTNSRQKSIAINGITHVGLYLGNGWMIAASSAHGKVVIQPIRELGRAIYAFARLPTKLSHPN